MIDLLAPSFYLLLGLSLGAYWAHTRKFALEKIRLASEAKREQAQDKALDLLAEALRDIHKTQLKTVEQLEKLSFNAEVQGKTLKTLLQGFRKRIKTGAMH